MRPRPRVFSDDFKAQCVARILDGGENRSRICADHNLSSSVIHRWIVDETERREILNESRRPNTASQVVVRDLQRSLTKVQRENDLLKQLVGLGSTVRRA